MDWKDLELGEKNLLNTYLKRYKSEASELNFTNLYLWREGYDITYKFIGDFLCVRHLDVMKKPFHLSPIGTGDVKPVLLELMEESNDNNVPLMLSPITKDKVDEYSKLCPGRFDCFLERENSDYVYSIEELINLEGRKFHDKKNMINRFMKDNQFEYLPITSDIIQDVEASAEEWCIIRNCEDYIELENEKSGIFECLEHFSKLDCDGAAIRVNGKIIAFTFGELITDDMVVIHIEKADPRIPGAYQMINQQFLLNKWSSYKWVNREGDMGMEGLRKAKLSYNPIRMIDKYCLRQIQ
ncbi:MAG TPA: phosphatidylglycerol lysyltransferase domain-containing protein [Candidatus Cloacimonadota bacterium]|nr:phosphatidylglycerol lysyltransferase domain-containing protein [Candidatus Cloacimonadota bacterium]